jgi:hypothetical protein
MQIKRLVHFRPAPPCLMLPEFAVLPAPTLKNSISSCSWAAWPPISSAVAASSSEARGVLLRGLVQLPHGAVDLADARLCSWLAPAISCTRSEVFLMLGTISSSRWPAFSAVVTLVAGELADLLRRNLAAFGQLAHFAGNHREALAVLAGTGGFDRRIQASRLVW